MIVLLVAVEGEFPRTLCPGGVQLVYTGCGKVNAAMHATEAVLTTGVNCIVNYGSAGAVDKNLSLKLVEVGCVLQRDMDAYPLAERGVTPFDSAKTAGSIKVSDSPYVLGTGDNFVRKKPEIPVDMVDMEAYAIAKVALVHGIPARIFKFASDFADKNAAKDWERNLGRKAETFAGIVETIRDAWTLEKGSG